MPRIPLYKLFLCVAVYAVPLALLSGHEWVGAFYSAAIGTSLSGVILLTNRSNIQNVVNVYVGGIVGALLGISFLSLTRETMDSVCTSGVIGAIIGGYVASGWCRPKQPPGQAEANPAPTGDAGRTEP